MLATLPLALRWLAVMLAVVTEVCGVEPIAVPLLPVGTRYAAQVLVQNNRTDESAAWLLLLSTQTTGVVSTGNVSVPSGAPTSTVSVVIDGAQSSFPAAAAVAMQTSFTTDGAVGCEVNLDSTVSVAPAWNLSRVSPLFAAALEGIDGVVGLAGKVSGRPSDAAPCVVSCGIDVSPAAAASAADALSPLLHGLNFTDPRGAADGGGGTSWLHIGGVPEEVEAAVVWSEKMVTSRQGPFTFQLFRPTLCGVNLFANVTSSWVAAIDTASSCLSLPEEPFDALMSWLPVHCDSIVDHVFMTALQLPCVLRSAVEPSALPRLSFRLSESGPLHFIDLAQLVLSEGDGGVAAAGRLCVTRGRSIALASSLLTPALTTIVLGTLPLRSLYTVLDGVRSRVGFVNKVSGTEDVAGGNCLRPPSCEGGQWYYAARNKCVAPPCDLYYFQHLDVPTQTCVYVRRRVAAVKCWRCDSWVITGCVASPP
jgi:hypothetical protein